MSFPRQYAIIDSINAAAYGINININNALSGYASPPTIPGEAIFIIAVKSATNIPKSIVHIVAIITDSVGRNTLTAKPAKLAEKPRANINITNITLPPITIVGAPKSVKGLNTLISLVPNPKNRPSNCEDNVGIPTNINNNIIPIVVITNCTNLAI